MIALLVVDRCKSLVDFQIWAPEIERRIEPWLNNFHEDEIQVALHLLNSFLYISEGLIAQLFLAAFQNLSAITRSKGASLLPARSSWQHFFDTVIVTYVTGEIPSPTDSGYIFARLARDKLRIPELRIVEPSVAIRNLHSIPSRPVLFVDDFVGSGQQFIKTWKREYPINSGVAASFEQLALKRDHSGFFFCPAVCTQYGANEIELNCKGVILSPGNMLASVYSCFDETSLIWPRDFREEAVSTLEKISRRAGIPDTGGIDDWRGFHRLGLCLAFNHKTPDPTVPLFYWNRDGWQPLVNSP